MAKCIGSKQRHCRLGKTVFNVAKSLRLGQSVHKNCTCWRAPAGIVSCNAFATNSSFSETIGTNARTAPVLPRTVSSRLKASESPKHALFRTSALALYEACPLSDIQIFKVASAEMQTYSLLRTKVDSKSFFKDSTGGAAKTSSTMGHQCLFCVGNRFAKGLPWSLAITKTLAHTLLYSSSAKAWS